MSFLRDIEKKIDEEDKIAAILYSRCSRSKLSIAEHREVTKIIRDRKVPVHIFTERHTLDWCLLNQHDSLIKEIFARDDTGGEEWVSCLEKLVGYRRVNMNLIHCLMENEGRKKAPQKKVWEAMRSMLFQELLILCMAHIGLRIKEMPRSLNIMLPHAMHSLLEIPRELDREDISNLLDSLGKESFGIAIAYAGVHEGWGVAAMDFVNKRKPMGGLKTISDQEIYNMLLLSLDPSYVRKMRIKYDAHSQISCRLFILVVSLSDGYFTLDTTRNTKKTRFFKITSALPMEIQEKICSICYTRIKTRFSAKLVNEQLGLMIKMQTIV